MLYKITFGQVKANKVFATYIFKKNKCISYGNKALMTVKPKCYVIGLDAYGNKNLKDMNRNTLMCIPM